MEECKQNILAYLQGKYKETNWPFIDFTEVARKFGPYTKEACNQLRREGKLKAHDGTHGKVIELITE